MEFNFDQIVERHNTNCLKWDVADRIFQGKDLLPMWIADMDFPTAPAIQAELKKRVEQGVFGYGVLSAEYYQAVISWMKRRHHCEVKREQIIYSAGVVSALYYAIQAVTQPGDEVMVTASCLCTPSAMPRLWTASGPTAPIPSTPTPTGGSPSCRSIPTARPCLPWRPVRPLSTH